MVLPIAMLLSEWSDNQETGMDGISIDSGSNGLPHHSNRTENSSDNLTNVRSQTPETTETKLPRKVVHQRKQETNLKLILLKLDSLMRPNLKFNKFVPEVVNIKSNSNFPLTSHRKLKFRKLPPLPKFHPYSFSFEYDTKSPNFLPALESVENRSDHVSAIVPHKWSSQKSQYIFSEPLKFPIAPEFPEQSKVISFVSCTLGEYFRFRPMISFLVSMSKAQLPNTFRKAQNKCETSQVSHSKQSRPEKVQERTKSNKLVVRKQPHHRSNSHGNKSEKKVKEPNTETIKYPPSPMELTEISVEVRETNTKLQNLVTGMTLDILPPFDYFDQGVFTDELMTHKVLYASRLSFRDQTTVNPKSVDKESTSKEAPKSPLLTCDQLEKALTSKLSVHAEPFTYKPRKTAEKPRSKMKVTMETYMDFLSSFSDRTPKSATSSKSVTYTKFMEHLRNDHQKEKAKESQFQLKVHLALQELQGEQLTQEEEERQNISTPIGSEIRRNAASRPNSAENKNVEVWYGGRDILDLGSNIRDEFKEINRWQVGPDAKSNDKPDGNREWKK